jgi:hypothetical protein
LKQSWLKIGWSFWKHKLLVYFTLSHSCIEYIYGSLHVTCPKSFQIWTSYPGSLLCSALFLRKSLGKFKTTFVNDEKLQSLSVGSFNSQQADIWFVECHLFISWRKSIRFTKVAVWIMVAVNGICVDAQSKTSAKYCSI